MKLLFFALALVAQSFSLNVSVRDLTPTYLQDVFLERASKINDLPIPGACQMQLLYMYKNFQKLSIFPMIDSWGKIPAGLMLGNVHSIGNFDQCIDFNRKLPIAFGNLEGQYCNVHISLAPSSQEIMETNKLMNRMSENRAFGLALKAGICLPKSCSLRELQAVLPFKISSCKNKDPIPFESLDYVTIGISSLIAFLLFVGTFYDYLWRGPNKNPYLMAFSVPSNAEKLFNVSSKKNKNNIDCVNGIRVIFMIWVIFCHSFASNMAVPKINLIDYIKWTRTYFAVLTYNGWISVDSFFYLSELLISWIGMKEIEKRKGWINVPLMYLHRYLRLTPMVAFLMLFAMSLLKFFGNGPFWDLFLKVGNDKCEDNWWMNLLYIQNYAADVICIQQTWYLAIDFQLFLFSPLILYGLWRWGQKCFIGAALLIALSCGCIFGIFYKYDVAGALVINDKHVGDRMDHYYYKTHTRYAIWLIGMCFGYILYKSRDQDVKIPWYTQVFGWVATAGILYGVVLAPQTTIHGYKMATSTFSAAAYESFGKIGWGLMMSWVVFACYHGYGGVVNSFLANPLWQPLARISFTMFLVHMLVMGVIDGNGRTSTHFSDFDSILLFWSHFGITVLVSIVLVLAVESPLIGFERILLVSKKEENVEVVRDEVPKEIKDMA
ncbi:hypothetical protein ACFFRR_006458 [Megaselia abdita]